MTIRKVPGGNYVPTWRDMLAKGRARRRAARPKRDILMVQTALRNLRMRYCQEVSFWNPYHVGKHSDLDGGLQWVDFVAKTEQPLAIILDDPMKRWKEHEKAYHFNKLKGLGERIRTLILPHGHSSQEYQILIHRFLHSQRKPYER